METINRDSGTHVEAVFDLSLRVGIRDFFRTRDDNGCIDEII